MSTEVGKRRFNLAVDSLLLGAHDAGFVRKHENILSDPQWASIIWECPGGCHRILCYVSERHDEVYITRGVVRPKGK